MKLRKRIISQLRGCNDKALQTKSLALLLFYRMRVSEKGNKAFFSKGMTHNRIKDFSYNKMRLVTGMHIDTIKKRLRVAEKNGWVTRVGKDLLINAKALKSSHVRNNYTLVGEFEKVQDLQDWLLAHIVVSIQESKEFVKGIFDKLRSPRDLKEFKKVRRLVKEKYPQLLDGNFEDHGISYKCLIMNMGVRRTKLKDILNLGEKCNLFKRHSHSIQLGEEENRFCHMLDSMDVLLDYLKAKFGRLVKYFFAKNFTIVRLANTYSIPFSLNPTIVPIYRKIKKEKKKQGEN